MKRNETGHIVAASALKSFYAVYINFSAVDMNKAGNIAGTADWVSLCNIKKVHLLLFNFLSYIEGKNKLVSNPLGESLAHSF